MLVLGLARSGEAVAKLLLRLGARVTASDVSAEERVSEQADELRRLGITVVTGGHPLELLDGCDLIVKNPGIRYDVPIIAEALNRRIPVYTEIEIAYLAASSPILAITGSNGKTTTTTLVGEMFKHAEKDAFVAGNIGTALSSVALSATAGAWIVAELSSFQLLGTRSFRPRIAVLLNLYPAHLDYHGSFADYKDAKMRIFANLGAGDTAVLGYDQPHAAELSERLLSRDVSVAWFSLRGPVARGLYADAGQVYYRSEPGAEPLAVLPVAEIALRGEHNLENALAASAAALSAGLPLAAVRRALRSFAGVMHRLEYVASVAGVKYYNDSKATNPQAAIRAITSFAEPVVGILGGLERGDDLTPLVEPVRAHMKAVVVMGQSAGRMREMARLAGVEQVLSAATMEEAVKLAAAAAAPGDVVLLSPAAASWDMYPSFEERGRIFKEAVHKL